MDQSWQTSTQLSIEPTPESLQKEQINNMAYGLLDFSGDLPCDSMHTFLQLNLLVAEEVGKEILYDTKFKSLWYNKLSNFSDLFEISNINQKLFVKRFNIQQIPSNILENMSSLLVFANQDTYDMYAKQQHNELTVVQSRISSQKPEQQSTLIYLGKKLNFFCNVVAAFIPFLNVSDEVKVNVIFSAVQNALWNLSSFDGSVHWVVIQSPSVIPNTSPLIAWHAVLSAFRDIVDKYPEIYRTKFLYVFQPINKFDELLLSLLLQIYFPRSANEQQYNKYRIYLSIPDFLDIQQQCKVSQSQDLKFLYQQLRETEAYVQPSQLVKLKSPHTAIYMFEQQLKSASLEYIEPLNLILPLTTQFQQEQAWGVLAFNFNKKQTFSETLLRDTCLWLVRNTGLHAQKPFYLIWFVGCYEARQLLLQLAEKLPELWMKRIVLIVVRPFSNFRSWQSQLRPRLQLDPVVCENLTVLKQKFDFIRTGQEIDAWDAAQD